MTLKGYPFYFYIFFFYTKKEVSFCEWSKKNLLTFVYKNFNNETERTKERRLHPVDPVPGQSTHQRPRCKGPESKDLSSTTLMLRIKHKKKVNRSVPTRLQDFRYKKIG